MLNSDYVITAHHYHWVVNLNVEACFAKSRYAFLRGTKFPMLLPLHIGLFPE
jgi:hypothetical protein